MGEQPKATDLALVQHFSHMHHHRCVVLEGVREAAFRNVDHLTRTMRELGTERITTQTSLAKVQDRMLRDQGLQPSASQRWWLGSGALNMWEIYLCLLSAELEAYLSMRSSFPSAELDEFIQVNAPVLGRLRALRDKFLHPAKDEAYDGLLRGFVEATEQNYPSHLPFGKHLQILLDEHLEHLKEHLADSIANEVAHLPANALHALLTRKTAMLDKALRAAERATDREAIQRLMDDQKRLIDEHKRLGEHLGFDPPGKEPLHMRQKKRVRRLFRLMDRMSNTPLPSTDYQSVSNGTQTPIHDNLFSLIRIPRDFQSSGYFLGTQLSSFVLSTQRDYANLVLRALLLFNESYQFNAARLKQAFPSMTNAEILRTPDWSRRMMPTCFEDYVRIQSGQSAGMVSLALLADPLRMYAKTVSRRPEFRVPTLDRAADEDNLKKLSAWRNTIFHVPDSRVQSVERVELDYLDIAAPDEHRELFTGLARFYLRGDGPAGDSG